MILYITVLLLAIMQHPKTLKGLGNEADFLGFLHKLVPPFTTFRAIPILASNSRRFKKTTPRLGESAFKFLKDNSPH